jgi:hypothetical protein
VGLVVVGIDTEGCAEGLLRLADLPLHRQGDAEMIVGLDQILFEPDGLPVAGNIAITMGYYANVDDAVMEAVLGGNRNASRNKDTNRAAG